MNSIESIRQQAKESVAQLVAGSSLIPFAKESIDSKLDNLQDVVSDELSSLAEKLKNALNDKFHILLSDIDLVFKALEENTSSTEEIYPKNCKFIKYTEDKQLGICVVEYEPQVRTIIDFSEGERTYRLAFPYMVFLITYDIIEEDDTKWYYPKSCGVCFRYAPLLSLDNMLYKCPMPHIQSTSSCMPVPSRKHSLVELVDEFIGLFWSSAFHYDFTSYGGKMTYKRKIIGSYDEWSKIEPLEILKCKTDEEGTLNHVIQCCIGRRHPINGKNEVSDLVDDFVYDLGRGIQSACEVAYDAIEVKLQAEKE